MQYDGALELNFLEMECWSGVIQWENSASLPCAAWVGSVVEVGTACRHGKSLKV